MEVEVRLVCAELLRYGNESAYDMFLEVKSWHAQFYQGRSFDDLLAAAEVGCMSLIADAISCIAKLVGILV